MTSSTHSERQLAETEKPAIETILDRVRRWLTSATGRRLHVAKALSWRVVATSTTVVVSYLVTGDLLVGATIGGIEATSKIGLYYVHERWWARLAGSVV